MILHRSVPIVPLAFLVGLSIATAAVAEIVTEENVTYRTVDGEELQLDIARPAGEGP